jgi:arylsulfatase A-like enzyme
MTKEICRPVTRRKFATVGTGAAFAAATAAAARRKPNIIFILTDDQGYGDLSCHGNPILRTPHIDRVHNEAVRFTDFHASPTCAPTRASLMSGRHEFRSGVTHTIYERERLSLRATTIAQVLKSAGYATGIFGKWHLGDAAPYQPNARGFDEVFIHGCGGIGQHYPGTCSDAPGNRYFNPAILHNGRFEKTEGYCTDVFFGQALKWMDSRRRDAGKAPFFAYITPNAPHEPLDCPEEYIAQYRGRAPDEKVARFFGMIANIDDNVGRVTGSLRDWGIERDTVLIFMTDNGGTNGVKVFNAGMRGAKNTPFEGGVRVPLFVRWPGRFAARDETRLTAAIDLFPTLAGIAGAAVPANLALDGRTLLPLLGNDRRAVWDDRYLFTHTGRWAKGKAAQSKYGRCRVRSTRFSMVNLDRGPTGWELYDLEADRAESRDVAAAHPEVVSAMSAAYDRWWESVLPALENEDAVPPQTAPYWELYERQKVSGGPGAL